MSRQLYAACLAALVLLSASPAHATGPTDTLRDFFARVNGLIQAPADQMTLAARLALIHRMTHEVFDVRRAAANALGKEWTARPPSEQEEFVGLFDDLLQRGYLGLISSKAKIAGGVNVTFIDESLTGDSAVVRTALAARSNGELAIDYRMSRADGTWRVVDAIIDGVSLVANYRAQVMRIRHRSTHRDLIALMRSLAGKAANPAAAEAVTSTNSTTFAGADTPAAAVWTPPVEMTPASVTAASVTAASLTAASLTAPSVPPPTRTASPAASASPTAAAAAATSNSSASHALCGETASKTSVPSPSLRSAQPDPTRFWVQIGAFRDSEAAAQLVERLADPGVTIVTLPSPGRPTVPVMWVCVGPFATRSAVDAKALELAAAGYRALIAARLP